MIWPGIEPWSTRPLANTLPNWRMSWSTKPLLDHSKLMKQLNWTLITITILWTRLTLHYGNIFTGAKKLWKKNNFSWSQETVILENKNIRIQTCLHFKYTSKNSKVIFKCHWKRALCIPASCQNNQSKQTARILFWVCYCIDPFKLIIIIMLCCYYRFPWLSLTIHLYHPLLLADRVDYVLYPYRILVDKF